MSDKLFAVYLGGRAPKCNTELHDVVFVVGAKIEDTYEQLMDKWFGTPVGLHIDSWMHVEVVDGYRVGLSTAKPANDGKLFFVNLGSYGKEFTEIHANKLLVAKTIPEAKRRAKAELLTGWHNPVHTDDLYDVDSCFEINSVGGLYITLEKTGEPDAMKPDNKYKILPKAVVEDYLKHHGMTDTANYRDSFS